jgi:hypothetical protein
MERAALERFREELCCIHAAMVSHQARLIDKIAEATSGGYWQADGAGSVADWLMATLRVDYRTASGWVELARRLKELPVLAQSFSEGRMPFESVAAAARLAEPETDAFITAEAEAVAAPTLLKALRNKEALEAQQASPAPRSSLRWFFDNEGWCRFMGWLSPEEGAKVIAAIERAEDHLDGPDPDTGAWDPADTKAAHGLVALSDTALGSDDDPGRATVVVHIDAEALESGEGSGELSAGGVVPAQVVRKLACDARIETVLEASAGAVGIGRARRQIPAHLLRYLKKRDGGCRFPGCARRRHLHAHHIKHWVNGGPTDITNLVMVCNRHHSLLHEGGWSLSGNPEPGPGRGSSLRFLRQDGSVYVPAPPVDAARAGVDGPPPVGGPPPDPAAAPPGVLRPLALVGAALPEKLL